VSTEHAPFNSRPPAIASPTLLENLKTENKKNYKGGGFLIRKRNFVGLLRKEEINLIL
jgi:hypothetical protein